MGTVRAEPRLWARFVERGGTCFDTARHYGDESEAALGAFVERHGLRDRITIVGKGAHPPACAPEHLAPDLERSLELLRADRLDVFLLHRDDPRVPVDEWADALAELLAAGRVAAIGASNWTSERIDAFDVVAARRGLPGFALVSNQLSLAEMVEPVWEGCLRADLAWHERTGRTLLAWSAQARGFFSRREPDEELGRCWLSARNLERRRRTEELAAARGVPPVAVALAWVLARPFPTHAAVGPRDEAELEACLAGARLELDPAEADWLERGTAP